MSSLSAILFFGMHGSGKSTQAELLAKLPGYETISSGDLIRSVDVRMLEKEVAKQVLYCRETEEYLADEYMMQLVDTRLVNPEVTYVLDGIPANMNQLEHLLERVIIKNSFFFDIDEGLAVSRLLSRARGKDLSKEAIAKRNEPYFTHTVPALKENEDLPFTRIDASYSVMYIHKQVRTFLRV